LQKGKESRVNTEGCYTIEGGLIHLMIKAVPGSSKNAFAGLRNRRLRIKIAAQAEDGKANEALRSFLAAALGVPKKDLTFRAGEKSRLKTVTLPLSAEGRLKSIIG
jgi:uncharacterized protein (TIGR00251 family)